MPATITLVASVLATGVLSFVIGVVAANCFSRRRLEEADDQYETLKRDFDTVSAVNLQLLRRQTSRAEDESDPHTLQRFLDVYDDAKRCLHRALDRHNATAPRPIVINRDGANILAALNKLPERSFSDAPGEDAGLRAWLRRVFQLDLERRKTRAGPSVDDVLALEGERALWWRALRHAA